MIDPAYEYPAWSRGWDPNLGPSWECDTDQFPVIRLAPDYSVLTILRARCRAWVTKVMGF